MSLVVAKKSRGRPPKKAYKEGEEPEPSLVEDETEKENVEIKTPGKMTNNNKDLANSANDKSEDDADDGCKDEINNHSFATKSNAIKDLDNDVDNEEEENDSNDESSNKNKRNKKSDVTYKDDSESEEEQFSEENSEDDFDPKKAPPKKKSPLKKKGRGRPSAKKSAGRGRPSGGQGAPKKKKSSPVRYEYELSDTTDSEIDDGAKSDDTDDMNYRPYGEVRVIKKRKVSKEFSSESDGGDWKPGKAFPGQKKVTKVKKKRLSQDGTAQKGRGRPPKESKGKGSPKEEGEHNDHLDDSKEASKEDEGKTKLDGYIEASPATLAPAKRRGRPKVAAKKSQVEDGNEEDGAAQEEE